MPENTQFDSSSVERGHKALNNLDPQEEPMGFSSIWICGKSYLKQDLELIIDFWSLLNRIDKITKIEQRVKALEHWRALGHYLFNP